MTRLTREEKQYIRNYAKANLHDEELTEVFIINTSPCTETICFNSTRHSFTGERFLSGTKYNAMQRDTVYSPKQLAI